MIIRDELSQRRKNVSILSRGRKFFYDAALLGLICFTFVVRSPGIMFELPDLVSSDEAVLLNPVIHYIETRSFFTGAMKRHLELYYGPLNVSENPTFTIFHQMQESYFTPVGFCDTIRKTVTGIVYKSVKLPPRLLNTELWLANVFNSFR